MAKRVTIPADRPLISGVNVATINGEALIGKKVNDIVLSAESETVIIEVSYVENNFTISSISKEIKQNDICLIVINYKDDYIMYVMGIAVDSTHIRPVIISAKSEETYYVFTEIPSLIYNGITNLNLFVGKDVTNEVNLFIMVIIGHHTIPYVNDLNGDSDVILNITAETTDFPAERQYILFGQYINSLNYSLGTSIAVDAVETIVISSLTNQYIVINSIQPTTAVEGLIVSTPFYNGSNWCVQIYNKSTSAFNGDLKIDYFITKK